MASTASGQARASAGSTCRPTTSPGVVATSTWPDHALDPRRVVRSPGRRRRRPPAAASSPRGARGLRRRAGRPTQSRPVTMSPVSSHRAVISRLPTECPRQLAVAREPVLHHAAPGAPPRVVAAQRGERHAQVAGRHDVELATQPPARPAVVGDRDHGRHVVGDPSQRPQARRQPVAAAERDHPAAGGPWSAAYRGRSRSLAPEVAVHDQHLEPDLRRAGPPGSRPSPRCGACRRCSRSPR